MPGFTGRGATITFGTTSYSGKYIEIGEAEQERGVVDASTLDLAITDEAINIPGDNPTPGSFRCRTRWVGATAPANPFAVPETITVTFAKEVAASAAPANVAGTGYITSRRILPNLQRSQLNEGMLVVQWDGNTGPTYTAEA